MPAIAFLKANVADSQSIFGAGLLGFGLAYPPNLVDDFRLGKVSGRIPDWIVVDDWYREVWYVSGWFNGLKVLEPEAFQFVEQRLKNEYIVAFDQGGFTIYKRDSIRSKNAP
jgi:hypothetical protein